jgi:hypothetical protein
VAKRIWVWEKFVRCWWLDVSSFVSFSIWMNDGNSTGSNRMLFSRLESPTLSSPNNWKFLRRNWPALFVLYCIVL